MEYSPGSAESHADWKAAETYPASLLGLMLEGYKFLQIQDTFRKSETVKNWADTLPSMPYVHDISLRHDVEDAKRLQEGTLGCPLPPSVRILPYFVTVSFFSVYLIFKKVTCLLKLLPDYYLFPLLCSYC